MAVRALLLLFLSTTVSAGLLQFTQQPEAQEVRIGDPVTLQCAVSSGTINGWLYNNDPLSEGGDVAIDGNSLMISSYQTHLAGDYRCVATSSDTSATQVTHSATLSHFAQRTFVQHPQDFTVYLVPVVGGGTIREAAAFNCEFNTLDYGTRPRITWEINNGGNISSVELVATGRLAAFQYDHTGYLQIHFPVDGDNGSQVRCVAADPANPDDPVVESDWATVIISGDLRPAEQPVFSTEPPQPTVHFIEGQELVLGCSKTTTDYSLGITWWQNDFQFFFQGLTFTFLPDTEQVEVYGRTNIKLLPGFNHTGFNYSCTVVVDEDFNFLELTTTVIPTPPPPPSVSTDQGEVKILMYGESGEFQVANYTGAIQWWYNGAPIEGGDGQYSIDTSNNSLTVLNVDLDSGGVYQAELLGLSPPQFMNFDVTVQADECAQSLHDCDSNAKCSDTTESFTCACNSGFVGDGKTCADIDECTSGDHTCHQNAACMNTEGSFTCACNSGFMGDGQTCADINECTSGDHTCHQNAACVNTEGSFTCACNSGFMGDGQTCADINECTSGDHTCHQNAACVNTEGSFTCACNSGFMGDGQTCTDICQLAPDPGPCESYQPHYYYNATSGRCEEFVYGGCQGNDNRFVTESECAQNCDPNVAGRSASGSGDLEGWEIGLIVLLLWILLVLVLCYICCCCIGCWKRRRRHYYAEEKEKKYEEGLQSYRGLEEKEDMEMV